MTDELEAAPHAAPAPARDAGAVPSPEVTIRIDPGLPVPAVSSPLPVLPAPGGDALLTGRAAAAPFVLEGRTATLIGWERGQVQLVQVSGRSAAKDLRVDVGTAANVLMTPSFMTRELIGEWGSVLETSLAAPTLPLVAIQWRTPDGAPPLKDLTLSVILMPDARSVRYRACDTGVRAVDAEGDWIVDLRVVPEPASWTVVAGDGGGILVQAAVAARGPVTLLLAAGDADRADRAVSAGQHLLAHVRTADREADTGSLDTLATVAGADEMDRGVLWATRRLQAAVRRACAKPPSPRRDPGALFWTGVGAAAVGDGLSAVDVLGLLDTFEGDADIGLGCPLPIEALATVLAARTVLTLGKPGTLPDRVRSLDPELIDSARRTGGDRWTVWSLSLRRSADALRFSAPADLIDMLRAEASAPPGGGSLPLPVVGQGPPPSAGALLERLLFPSASRGLAPAGDVHLDTLDPWVRFARGGVADAYGAWRNRLAKGLAPGDARSRGTWDSVSPTEPEVSAPGAGILLAGLAHGLLGLDPDAPSGRLRIAPQLPRHVRSLEVRGLPVGHARLSLAYDRTGARHRFLLDLTHGREPPMAVLCPTLPCTNLRAMLIDGKQADLETEQAPEGLIVRVQMPVDGRRVLEVDELTDAAGT